MPDPDHPVQFRLLWSWTKKFSVSSGRKSDNYDWFDHSFQICQQLLNIIPQLLKLSSYLYKHAKQSRPISPTRYIYFISYPKGISLERLSPCTIKRTTKLLTEINKINNPIQLINRIPTIPAPVLKSKSAKVDKWIEVKGSSSLPVCIFQGIIPL